VEISEHVAALDREGRRLADVAATASWEAAAPSCPGWTLRDVVTHVGGVHRWAAAIVGGALTRPDPETSAAVGSGPPDAELLDWFRSGHAALVRTLQKADPAVPCWSFLPAATPLASWARRQAHETAIHRVDVELAAGAEVSRFDELFALDGLDELLFAFAPRRRRSGITADPPEIIEVRPAQAPGRRVRIGPSGIETSELERPEPANDEAVRARCRVSGSAHELYLWSWHRPSAVTVAGDEAVLDKWARMTVAWS
jgi:uncharacterized protein (TIGR03083 family)